MAVFEYNTSNEVVKKLAELATHTSYVYRGYSYHNQLFPTLVRNKKTEKEILLLREFERYSSLYYQANSPMDFLACAQHYGLSTRLLDFTYNPFVALFFAIHDKKDSSRCENADEETYYYLRYCDANNNILIRDFPVFDKMYLYEIKSNAQNCRYIIDTINRMFDKDYPFDAEGGSIRSNETAIGAFFSSLAIRHDIKNVESYVSLNKEKVYSNRIVFIDNNQSNQRLLMQQGLFMLPYKLSVDEHLSIMNMNTDIIKIHHSTREELLRYLNTIGINTYKIMPDLVSVCSEIERSV